MKKLQHNVYSETTTIVLQDQLYSKCALIIGIFLTVIKKIPIVRLSRQTALFSKIPIVKLCLDEQHYSVGILPTSPFFLVRIFHNSHSLALLFPAVCCSYSLTIHAEFCTHTSFDDICWEWKTTCSHHVVAKRKVNKGVYL